MSTIVQSAEQGTAGVVIWGDHHSEATKTDCTEIKNYIDNFLGPLVKSMDVYRFLGNRVRFFSVGPEY